MVAAAAAGEEGTVPEWGLSPWERGDSPRSGTVPGSRRSGTVPGSRYSLTICMPRSP